jgi:hypothetical protein
MDRRLAAKEFETTTRIAREDGLSRDFAPEG